jgi:membrane complex biogenesis BtpA family protein
MTFQDLFPSPKPLIACLHLLPLPGAPRYTGSMRPVYETALAEAEIFTRYPIDGLIVENFRDVPFYPHQVPPETVAALAAVTREIVKTVQLPVGLNVLRNDACAAVAIATAAEAAFVRVNVHMYPVVSDQGLLQGTSHETLRLRAALQSQVLIFADARVKHATPLGAYALATETRDVAERGLADAIIVSGAATGAATSPEDIDVVRQHTTLPVLVGSGVTPDNLHTVYANVDGFIVGSFFKHAGKAEHLVQEERVKAFTDTMHALAHDRRRMA